AVAAGVWYFVLRSDAPPPVSIENAVGSLSTPTGPDQASKATTTPSGSSSASASTGLAGEWILAPNSNSFVGYRVQEQLARIGANTAVGRTSTITANMTFDGSAISKLQVTADLTKLKSDESLRDGQLRNQAIETGRFPNATFVLTSPISIGAAPAEGQTVSKTIQGDLTLHGVTRSITMDVQGQMKSGQVVVVGSTTIQFADYNIGQPRGANVLSIDDHGVMELQLVFQKASG
ncbi:MAG TPA: YceI family protein, partial [Dehalococcoidia bacterium]